MNFNWMSWFGGAKMKSYSDAPTPFISWDLENAPSIKWKHIDGPLLVFRDGQVHWLTLLERFQCKFGFHNAWTLEQKLRPNLTKLMIEVMHARVREELLNEKG